MRALIDTHTFLWLASDESKLSPGVLAIAKDPVTQLLFSMASAWELAIKVGRGKLQLQTTLEDLIIDTPRRLLLEPLEIAATHLVVVSRLPEHHKDPFDRLLVAQAQVENVPLISADVHLDAYGIQRIW
jgi:PIN domain nuclease of toxin-antitoxin system